MNKYAQNIMKWICIRSERRCTMNKYAKNIMDAVMDWLQDDEEETVQTILYLYKTTTDTALKSTIFLIAPIILAPFFVIGIFTFYKFSNCDIGGNCPCCAIAPCITCWST